MFVKERETVLDLHVQTVVPGRVARTVSVVRVPVHRPRSIVLAPVYAA